MKFKKVKMSRYQLYKGVVIGLVLLWCASLELIAQQQSLHTMFMYNKLLVNPAYAGYHEHLCATGHIREQWIGFDGAPKTQSLSVHGPLSSQRIGIGFNIQRRSIGVSSATTIDGIYAYRVPTGTGTLSLGVQASARFLEVDYTDPNVRTVQDIDLDSGVESISDNKVIANVGAGLYYHTSTFYLGLSAPRLMNADIDFELNNLFIAREQAHYYLMSGIALRLDHRMSFVPQVMFRYTPNAPVDIDLNLGIRWWEDYSAGITFRKGGIDDRLLESIDVMASAKVLRGLRIGAAYDITLSELRQYSNGSVEVMLMYCFGEPAKPATFINPRYF